MLKKNKSFIAQFTLPAVIMFCLVFVYPLIRTVAMSFFSVENITGELSLWKANGINNYIQLFKTPVFMQCLRNLFVIWIAGGVFVLSLALIFAALLNVGIKGKAFLRSAIYMPCTISTVAIALMWLNYVFDGNYGMLQAMFSFVGWEKAAAISWTDPDHRFLAMFIGYCVTSVGYHMVIFSSGIESIPSDYYEAARIDGCNKIKEFFCITLPMIRGVLKTNLIMWSISCAGFYTWSMMFSGGGDGTVNASTCTPVAYMYLKLFGAGFAVTERDAGLAAAVGVITGAFVLICFLLINICVKDDDLEY